MHILANTSACSGCSLCVGICYSGACQVSKAVSVKELVGSINKLLTEIPVNPKLFSEETEDKIARMFNEFRGIPRA